MSESWRDILDEFEVEATETSAPGDRTGDWNQLLGVFGTAGFLRLLTDGELLLLELAPPAGVEQFTERVAAAGWTAVAEGPPALFEREFPDRDGFRDVWIALARVGDAIRDDDADEFGAAMEPTDPGEDARGSTAEPEDDGGGETDESPNEEADSSTGGGAFETIGAPADRPALPDGAFAWTSARRGEGVDVVLGFGTVLEPADYDRLEQRLVRNLRGKYDVDVEVDSDHEITMQLDRDARMRVALRVVPDRGVSKASASEVESNVEEYFGKLSELSGSGIDPLVFLGVTASRRHESSTDTKKEKLDEESAPSGGSAFETIGDDEEPSDSPSRTEWVVDDDEREDDDESTGVVLGVTSDPDPDDPLEPGRFDDPRLKGPDATTSLVDVVLRHPGYSDRSIGQVLSILLSIEYSGSLELINKAPTVIAWGVARERAQTMKTVIEGAGGRVFLAEPGEFHEE